MLDRLELGLGAKPALIIVDASIGFTDPQCALGCQCDDAVAQMRRLVDLFREKQLPRFFTTVSYRNSDEAKIFRRRLPALEELTDDKPWAQIDSRLGRADIEPLIRKCWASAFFGTPLAEMFKNDRVDSIVVCGLTTSGCVRATAVDALQHDYPTVVVSDAVADRDPAAHAANLHDLQAKYADVTTVDKIALMLSRTRDLAEA